MTPEELKSLKQQDLGFLDPEVPLSQNISHSNWAKTLSKLFNKKDMKILEIGSREVTGKSSARTGLFSNADYVGFDYYQGPNVDVQGDIHRLTDYFEETEKFDLIYSSAVFEHLAMPWVAAEQISKQLKLGGCVFVETHFSFKSHERPWHFFQFSDMALRVLFSPALGFECIEAGMDNPMVARFSYNATEYLQKVLVDRLYCHSEYLGQKVAEVEEFRWEKTTVNQLIGDAIYPKPTHSTT